MFCGRSVCGELRLSESPVSLSLQVAILCQFLREVDYKTAFKALQEQNRCMLQQKVHKYTYAICECVR